MQLGVHTWPLGLEARPIEKRDAEAWADLLAAAERVDSADEHYDADDLIEELDDPHLRADIDAVGLWSDEQMIGFGSVSSQPGQSEVGIVRGQGTVHPGWRRRGIGRALLDWLDQRAAALHTLRNPDLPGELHIGALSTNAGLRALLDAAGFEVCRYFSSMKRSIGSSESLPRVDPPAGLRLIRFEAAYDEATRVADNEAFLDHWGFTPCDRETWEVRVTGSRAFRPAMSHLLLDGDDVASYVLAFEFDADTAITGERDLYVDSVGTRRAYRGKGAAKALLAKTLEAAAQAGFQSASLGVDADSPTGAVGLYRNLGFQVEHQWIRHRRRLRGASVTS